MTQEESFILINMDDGSVEDEGDPPTLQTDSGLESTNESPLAEDTLIPVTSPCPIEHPIIWDEEKQKRQESIKHILDKSISIDEEMLTIPLTPTQIICNIINTSKITNNNNMERLPSILRRTSIYDVIHSDVQLTQRRVSFPTDRNILACYKEPDLRTPFYLHNVMTPEEILQNYQNSCKKHNTIELDAIKNQILKIRNNINHSAILNMASVNITMEVCETLEDLFKVVNFHTIIIKDCTFNIESVREFINILEYYNCVSQLQTTDLYKNLEAWKTFCNMISRTEKLESLTFESFNFTDNYMKNLLSHVKVNETITTLRFCNSKISNTVALNLVDTLSVSSSIQELYLPQTALYTKEADYLGRMLQKNFNLKVLDISNNFIGDRGLEVLAKGLCHQIHPGCGLSVLVIFNNQITEKSGPIISNIIADCINLHTLNVGYNNLTDDVILKIEKSLSKTKSLEGFGLQSTLLTDIGICKLAEFIQTNTSLKKINLKGNKAIREDGLECFGKALTNTKIIRVELDETYPYSTEGAGLSEIVKQINAICTVNKSKEDQLDEEISTWSTSFSRKVSLSCEPVYYPQSSLSEPMNQSRKKSPSPSPIPSPGCSPQPRSRFSVSRVHDAEIAKPIVISKSRFKVSPVICTPVEIGAGDASTSPLLDDDEEVRQFINVRSSVSSIDSVDSVSTNRDSVYDSATPSCESD